MATLTAMAKRTARRDYGSGSVYQRRDGRWIGTIELGWEKKNGSKYVRRRKSVSGKTKADVVAELKKIRRQLDDTGVVAVNVPTVAVWLRRWLDTIAVNRLKPRTLMSYRSEVEKHLIPYIGHRKLNRLSIDHILALHTSLRNHPVDKPKRDADGNPIPETLAESSVLKAHAVLSRALDDAIPRGYVTRNVAKLVDRPSSKAEEHRGEMSTDDALAVLRAVADNPLGSRWGAALLLGTRQGETIGLEWNRVNLDAGVIDVSWQLQRLPYVHGCDPKCGRRFAGNCPARQIRVPPGFDHRPLDGGLFLTRPKNERARIVPLPATMLAWLRRRRRETPYDLVWTRPDGRPIDPRRDMDAWKGVLRAAGVADTPLHSARHTTASLLLTLGVPEDVRMQILGHSVVATARRYAHVDIALARAAMEKLGAALAIEQGDT